MNQNNRNNNRRRGRGGNRGQGGGNQGNRIDSRARGNAPQLLEKYKKLAHDASLNGDRVQTEYYLQFADHYFRVIADSRAQRDEQRPRQGNDRDYGRDQDREQSYDTSFDGAEDFDEQDEADRGHRSARRDRDEDRDHGRDHARDDDRTPAADEGERGGEGDEGDAPAADNPFTRDARARRPRTRGRSRPANDAGEDAGDEPGGNGFDPGVLPPSIAREEEAPARPKRTRKPRPAADGDEGALEAVS